MLFGRSKDKQPARVELEQRETLERSKEIWETENLPRLKEYLTYKNVSPQFNPNWETDGEMGKTINLFMQYAEEQKKHIKGLEVKVFEEPGRTPLIVITAPATEGAKGNSLFYGHLDKQPEAKGWDEGLGAWTPVVKEVDGRQRLYGRGGADDGYAMFAALTSLRLLDEKGVPRPRSTIIIEACEESGSLDLPYHLKLPEVAKKIGTPDTIICLDSGTGDYRRLWETASLRGLVDGTLSVRVLKKGRGGIHSGKSGPKPDALVTTMGILSQVVDKDGTVLLKKLHASLSEEQMSEIRKSAPILAKEIRKELDIPDDGKSTLEEDVALVLKQTREPALSVIGMSGLPVPDGAGNVYHPSVDLRLSMRIPANVDAATAAAEMKKTLEANPPRGTEVTFTINGAPGNGWEVPSHTAAFKKSIKDASEKYFGSEPGTLGEGGSIPFMKMLQEMFPEAQFLVTGVLGPESNAHGPNEFLDIDYVERLSAALAEMNAGPR